MMALWDLTPTLSGLDLICELLWPRQTIIAISMSTTGTCCLLQCAALGCESCHVLVTWLGMLGFPTWTLVTSEGIPQK